MMDEPMEEGESFSHCVSNDGLGVFGSWDMCACRWTYLQPCVFVSYSSHVCVCVCV